MPLNDAYGQTQATGSGVNPIALDKMSAVPGVENLMFALSVAQKNHQNVVELPWKSSNNPNTYIIKVTCGDGQEEPTWYLHVGGDEDQPVLWNYETADATLIHSLVTAECERTTYTAPLEQEIVGGLPEVALPDLPTSKNQYLPREHEQPLPTAPVKAAFNSSLEWNENTAPPSAPSNLQSSAPTYQQQSSAQAFQQHPSAQSFPQPTAQLFEQPSAQAPNSMATGMPPPAVASGYSPDAYHSLASPHQPSTQQMTNQDSNVATATRPLPAPVDLDRAAVDSIYKSFTNPDTGLISHAAFLFFLVNEFNRYQKDPKPLSVVRFDLCIKPANAESTISPMPSKTLQEAGKRMFSVMRPLDWAAHYEHDFAILMPFTGRAEAAELAQKIAAAIMQSPLVPGLDPRMLGLSMGIASMPDDCTHPGILLAAANDAKNRARKAGVPVMLFSDGI
ncbi:MAG TPA: diguanylate cyclase [Drouetiella sp.]|jgi:GGDEF domain-containing protein